MRVWGWRLGFPTKPLFAVLCLQDQTEILNQKQGKKKCMSRGKEGGAPIVPPLSPLPKPFYLTEPFWRHPVFPLVFMVLINVWVTAQSIPKKSGSLPSGIWNRAGWTQQNLLWPCPFCCLIWINICLLTSGHNAAASSQSLSVNLLMQG